MLRPPAALSQERIGAWKAAVKAREPVAIVVLGGGSRPLSPEYGVSNLEERSMERLRYGLWLGRETGAHGVENLLEHRLGDERVLFEIIGQKFADNRIDDAVVANAALTVRPSTAWEVQLIAGNLFDVRYYHPSNRPPDRYRQPQRALHLRVATRF